MKRVIAIALAALMLLAGVAALAENTLTVNGVGVVHVDADTAGFSLGVRVVGSDVMTAQSQVNERVDAVIAAMKAAGVADDAISTNGIGIYPNYDYSSNGEEQIIGYNAYNNIYVSVPDVDKVGSYIDAAFAAGANSLDYVEFTAKDTAEASDKALALAVESAKQKAKVLAEAAGVELGEILQINDGANVGYDVNAAYARAEEADAGSGTTVLAAKQSVTANVTITFAIGQ